jgi:FtsX-like permease family
VHPHCRHATALRLRRRRYVDPPEAQPLRRAGTQRIPDLLVLARPSQAGRFHPAGRIRPHRRRKNLSTVYPKEYPKKFSVHIETLTDLVVGRFRTTLHIVLAAVGLLLLIGCGNVANLLLARATTREKEFAIRAALGAARSRIVRQLLAESLLLAMTGAILGVFIAWGGLKGLVGLIPKQMMLAEAVIRLNTPVLFFALAVAVLTAIRCTVTQAMAYRPARQSGLRQALPWSERLPAWLLGIRLTVLVDVQSGGQTWRPHPQGRAFFAGHINRRNQVHSCACCLGELRRFLRQVPCSRAARTSG